jgi:hypothetical protein
LANLSLYETRNRKEAPSRLTSITTLVFSVCLASGAGALPASTSCEAIRELPYVAKAEVVVKVERPKHRIIRLRDLHFVPKDVLAKDLRDQQKDITDDEIKEVQKNQFEFLKRLGLKQIHLEGLFVLSSK